MTSPSLSSQPADMSGLGRLVLVSARCARLTEAVAGQLSCSARWGEGQRTAVMWPKQCEVGGKMSLDVGDEIGHIPCCEYVFDQ